jgi:hypothetical protein
MGTKRPHDKKIPDARSHYKHEAEYVNEGKAPTSSQKEFEKKNRDKKDRDPSGKTDR